MWEAIKSAWANAVAFVKGRLGELSTHFAIIIGAAVAAMQASYNLTGDAAKIMFALIFLQVITPEWKKKDKEDGDH